MATVSVCVVPTSQWFGSLHGMTQELFPKGLPGQETRGGPALSCLAASPVGCRGRMRHGLTEFGSLDLPRNVIPRLAELDFC